MHNRHKPPTTKFKIALLAAAVLAAQTLQLCSASHSPPFRHPRHRSVVATALRMKRPPRDNMRKHQFLSLNPQEYLGRLSSIAEQKKQSVLQTVRQLRQKKPGSLSRLRNVIRSFQQTLLPRDHVDTAQLLRACREHLALMRTGGTALRAVAKDLENNILKVEALFLKSPQEFRTIQSILQHEKNAGIHQPGGVLRDPSATIGLLWIRRNLEFQHELYAFLADKQAAAKGVLPRDAALEAYRLILRPFHGWALRKAYEACLSSQMPPREVFLAKFGGLDVADISDDVEDAIVEDLKRLVATWGPLLSRWKRAHLQMDLEDFRQV